MGTKMSFSKKDLTVTLVCIVFLLATLGSVGVSGRRRAKEAVCLDSGARPSVCSRRTMRGDL
jgi:hypothetical protein